MTEHPTHTRLVVTSAGGETVARVADWNAVTEADVPVVTGEFAALLSAGSPPRLVIDLAGAAFVGSSMLAGFVRLHRLAAAAECRLALVNAGPVVRQALALTRLDRVLDVRAAGLPAA